MPEKHKDRKCFVKHDSRRMTFQHKPGSDYTKTQNHNSSDQLRAPLQYVKVRSANILLFFKLNKYFCSVADIIICIIVDFFFLLNFQDLPMHKTFYAPKYTRQMHVSVGSGLI